MKTALVLLGCLALASAKELKLKIPMRDGFGLSTYIYIPDKGATQKTCILDASTYGHGGSEGSAKSMATSLGDDYCAIMQDMRGSGDSTGEDFTLWHSQGNDTFDTLKWTQEQEWSNGIVYQTGTSADGIGAFMGFTDNPPQLKKQYVNWASVDAHGFPFPGGAYRKGLNDGWLKATFRPQSSRLIAETKANEAPGPWWNDVNVTLGNKCENRDPFPAVLVGAWYDIFQNGNIEAYECYNKRNSNTKLVMEACGHCLLQACPIYLAEDIAHASLGGLLGTDLFAGRQSPSEIKNVTFFVMGAGDASGLAPAIGAPGNYYTSLEEWPKFNPVKYFFTSKGGAVVEKEATQTSLNYTYDPTHPVPSHGGNNLMIRCGALNQAEQENRPDVLRFTSDELTEDLAITGGLTATLFVSSSAVDTDFTAKLTDVYPSGKSVLLNDGIVRMRWRKGTAFSADPQLITPGQVYEVEIFMWSTSYIFPKGHKWRVSISSSNNPRFEPNPNNGLALSANGPNVTAHNNVFLGGSQASYMTMPVVQKSQLPKVDVKAVIDRWFDERPASWRENIPKMREAAITSIPSYEL
eukprot:TRINITY_DN1795_c0_g2_i4.p1 TRINITY_DN1795_c0_g2~~TRINITY_DN1795_c0_g2_i4.p1  ORF type:complete len:600 (+),score=198.98 TRINITY_DN1795_c0_g2_i4:66-1802(+)